jgi:hypothetical protein
MTDSSNNNKSACSSASQINGSNSYYQGMPDDVFSPLINTNSSSTNNDNNNSCNGVLFKGYNNSSLSFRNGNSPYENVISNENSHNQRQYPLLQVQSPRLGVRVTAQMNNNCNTRTIIPKNSMNGSSNVNNFGENIDLNHSVTLNGSLIPLTSYNGINHQQNRNVLEKVEHTIPISTFPPTPPKSKLSVSFANSVKEFGDEEDENADIKSERDNSSIIKTCSNANSNKDNRSIVKTIATEVQVHTVESQVHKDDDKTAEDKYGNQTCPSSISNTNNVNECSETFKAEAENINQSIQSSPPPAICISQYGNDVRDVQKPSNSINTTGNQFLSSSSASQIYTNASQNSSQNEATVGECNKAVNNIKIENVENENVSHFYVLSKNNYNN